MKINVLITPRSYGKADPEPFKMLTDRGISIVRNETDSILNREQMKNAIQDCDGIIVGVDPLDADIIAAAPKLRAIAKYGVGVDNIDIEAAAQRQIKVSRTVGANSEAVADYAFALMSALARKIIFIDKKCRSRDWSKVSTLDINNKTIGIIGFGAIGKNVARRCSGFGMRILAHDVCWNNEAAEKLGVIKAEPETIYRESDFISLHLPLIPETHKMIGKKELAMMKPTAVLVNTARGGLIDEEALLQALKERLIYGAGIDVFENEPPINPAWYELDNVILGSHCAASTLGASTNMGRMATENLIRDLGL